MGLIVLSVYTWIMEKKLCTKVNRYNRNLYCLFAVEVVTHCNACLKYANFGGTSAKRF